MLDACRLQMQLPGKSVREAAKLYDCHRKRWSWDRKSTIDSRSWYDLPEMLRQRAPNEPCSDFNWIWAHGQICLEFTFPLEMLKSINAERQWPLNINEVNVTFHTIYLFDTNCSSPILCPKLPSQARRKRAIVISSLRIRSSYAMTASSRNSCQLL